MSINTRNNSLLPAQPAFHTAILFPHKPVCFITERGNQMYYCEQADFSETLPAPKTNDDYLVEDYKEFLHNRSDFTREEFFRMNQRYVTSLECRYIDPEKIRAEAFAERMEALNNR